ncbi:MAG: hypothetical protein LBN74_09465 [Prevotella sp.]|jgi:hypothetical protein|nr:hypothetical protein [Prevotella sp.]
MSKTKIVIDADVIIHFLRGGYLSKLHTIFSGYEHIILDVVLNEVRKHSDTRVAIDNHLRHLKNLKVEEWNPEGMMKKEYFELTNNKGKGESACLIYCKYNKDVIASSNLRDIAAYCRENEITYVTTMDFLWQAYTKKIMSEDDCNEFIKKVIEAGSKLPNTKITAYSPRELFL